MPRRDGPHPRTALNVSKMIMRLQNPKPSVNDARREVIMEWLLAEDEVTRADLIAMFNLDNSTVASLLACMVEEGLITRVRYGVYCRGDYFHWYWSENRKPG